MGKLIFALILFVVGMAAARGLRSVAAAMEAQPQRPQSQRAARALRLGSRAALGLGIALPALIVLLSTFQYSLGGAAVPFLQIPGAPAESPRR